MLTYPTMLDIGTEEDEEIYVDVPERETAPAKPVTVPAPATTPAPAQPVKV